MKQDASGSGFSRSDSHERARMLIALSRPALPSIGTPRAGMSGAAGSSDAELSNGDESWLAAHLESCPACHQFAENARETIRSLRGIPVAADTSLVAKTRVRVHARAVELQRQQERFWVVAVCCSAVTLCSAVTTAALWRGFAWMGQQAGLAAPVWQGSFALFYLLPAVLAGIFLLSRGTFLADHGSTP